MSQLHCYVTDEVAEKLKQKAKEAQLPVSRYLALLVKKEVEQQWPDDYFQCFGSWQGGRLERENQENFETRQDFE